ncbi:MAG: glycosyltransferase family 4 protein [Patescibacteria group bacterium]|nr:glycosyltransferase family 4 protein [Patescibacteria group bacterium]MDE1988718.1 glycosyltransferase family 4 protein [Patescibacteria group bacterium]MDE2218055.1 glycosyltransferase family 4 protein [Patescibacteria group bacterium]
MKILIATGIYPPDIGGPATYSKFLYDELPKRGHSVEALSFGEVRELPKIIRHIIYFFKVLNRARKCDIIFAQDPVSVGLPAMLASKILRKKFLIRVAGDYAWEQAVQRFAVREGIDKFQFKRYGLKLELLRLIQKFVIRRAGKVITPSHYFNKIVSGWIGGGDKVETIYNGINLSRDNATVRRSNNSKFKKIISAGRLVPWKGFVTLIKIMNNLPEWRLVIAGDGPMKDELNNLIISLGLEDKVKLAGALPREELLSELRTSDLFILNTSFESFSFQTVEAMNMGAPVIATNIGNLKEIVEDGKDGILIDPDNEGQILSAIKKIAEDENFRDSIVQNAKKKSERFSIEKTLDNLIEVMAKL